MSSNFQHSKQFSNSRNAKIDEVKNESLNPKQVMAGSSKVMTHEEMQAQLKNSEMGRLLGVSHLL